MNERNVESKRGYKKKKEASNLMSIKIAHLKNLNKPSKIEKCLQENKIKNFILWKRNELRIFVTSTYVLHSL